MLGFLKGVLSSGKIIDGGMAALDKVVLTEEEKIEYKLQFVKATMPMNRARRAIAMMVAGIWSVHTVVATSLLLNESALFGEYYNYMTTNVSAPFLVIVGFYFWNERIIC